ncbi:helix-turn-helix transcriptional regulator [Streptomyces olivaceus]|nr:helix-turn-helix transcriptional regulator [Streptomyces olivaceus]
MKEVAPLDQNTLEVYRAFLFQDEDAHRPAQLADSADDCVKAAVARLVDLSLLTPSRESPGGLRAVDPSRGMRVLLQQEQHELARREHRIKHNTTMLDLLASEYAAVRRQAHSDGVERLYGADHISTRLEALAESCRHESLAFYLEPPAHPAHPADPGDRPADEPGQAAVPPRLYEQALARGARLRSIYLDGIVRDDATRSHALWTVEHRGEVRTAPSLPMGLLIVDTTAAVVGGLPGEDPESVLLFSGKPVVLAVRALFEAYWDHSDRFPCDDFGDAQADEVTPQERKLLELLAEGLTDGAVARALGISVRTERRKVAELMDRLGVSSRFAAGVQATRRRWI